MTQAWNETKIEVKKYVKWKIGAGIAQKAFA